MTYRSQADRALIVARIARKMPNITEAQVAQILTELAREGLILETTAKEVA